MIVHRYCPDCGQRSGEHYEGCSGSYVCRPSKELVEAVRALLVDHAELLHLFYVDNCDSINDPDCASSRAVRAAVEALLKKEGERA